MNNSHQSRICVPIAVSEARELRDAIARAAPLADLIEVRLDALADEAQLDEAMRELKDLLPVRPRPFLFTLRSPEEGGRRLLDRAQREDFWTRRLPGDPADGRLWPDYVDVEVELLASLSEAATRRLNEQCIVIGSYHDFKNRARDWPQLYERLKSAPARVLKVAVQVDDVTDCLAVFEMLQRAREDGRQMIAIGMGEAGILTRILAPSRGAFLTYGALDSKQSTAPGQLTAAALRDLYRIEAINAQTEIYGLVGSPVAHSLSPHMHNAGFTSRGVPAVYLPFEVRDVHEFMRRMVHPRTRELDWRLRGLSVTAPHKSAIMEHLDWMEDSAQAIGAVNTIIIEDDMLKGYNRDATAALAPLEGLVTWRGARVAVIGAGGAARAVLWSLREQGARATVFARDTTRARDTAHGFGADVAPLASAQFSSFDVVINSTPLGTRGKHENETPALANQLRGARVVYDLVYNPAETRLMREASAAGCRSVGGLGMLVHQAAAQFKLWTGREAPLAEMRAAAEKQM